MTAQGKKPRAKTVQHRLVPIRTKGVGKQLSWRCAGYNCCYVDNGGRIQIFGCPKPPDARW